MKKVTDDQVRDALAQTGNSISGAAKLLGVDRSGLRRRIRRMTNATSVYPIMPEGHRLRGVSSLQSVTDPVTGNTVMQWVRTEREREQETAARQALDALKAEIPRAEAILASPVPHDERLASLIVLTDYHLGMYSWAEETGADWGMQIAEDLLVNWFHKALASAPDAALGILAQLGDFLHYDSLEAVTPRSGHQLDADSRAQKMIRVGIRVLRRVITMMLDKYPKVHVLMAEGNHDVISSAWLREAFKVLYENEPRITIEVRPDPYYAVQWGETGLFFHHGHLKKPEAVDKVFARKFREIYGACKHVYGHMGHLHHKVVLESALMHIEQHPTLAAADSYASRNGFMSSRAASVITYDKQYGEVGRVSINPEMAKL